MTDEQVLLKEFQTLSENLKKEVIDFVQFLKQKHSPPAENGTPKKRKRKAGSAKGMFIMTEAFDEPLEDFAEYM